MTQFWNFRDRARRSVPVCLVLLLAAMPLLAQEDASPPGEGTQAPRTPFLGGFLRETRIVYPLRVGAWEAKDEKRYEPQEMGASVRFAAEASAGWLDVFFYPAGVLSDQEFALAAEGERDSLRQARLQSGDPAPDLGPLRRFDVRYPRADEQDPVKGYSLDMSARRGDAVYVSAMTFSLDRLYFVKARFSVAKRRTSRRDARRTVEAFMAEMVPMLTITSTGDCWMPLPIEALAAGDPAPEGTTSISVAPGPATEFLLGDRVLARDPESVGARLLMLLGMAQTGRLLQGCDGAEPANPDVDEGMREIRIEYRAPAESGRGDTILPRRIEVGQRRPRNEPQASAAMSWPRAAVAG